MDLKKVNGSYYNQTNFKMKVQVSFQNPIDTSTLAGVIFQTPAPIDQYGGYIFTLNSKGDWQLLHVETNKSFPSLGHGPASIDPHQVRIEVVVQNGMLECLINDKKVVSELDTPDASPSGVGLMVIDMQASSSSPVQFSKFELNADL